MISIIVPVYKAEKFLHRCVDSILDQSYTDFELLLINDGSPDNSGAICDEYAAKDSRVRVFHKENGGVSSARNLGLDNAKGEWVAFVDSDDWIDPIYLEKLIKDINSDWVIGGYVGIPGGEKCSTKDCSYDKNSFGMLIEQHQKDLIRSPWGSLLKLSIIRDNNISFDSKVRLGEDTIFNYQYLYYCESIKTISACNYFYYIGNEGISFNQKYELSLHEVQYIFKKLISELRGLYRKFRFDVNRALDMEFYNFISYCPISNLTNEDNLDIYYQLCKELNSNITDKEFYSDERYSPIVRGIATFKKMYEKKKYSEAYELYLMLNLITKKAPAGLSFRCKDFYLWFFLIKREHYIILCVLMKFYVYMKDLKMILVNRMHV